MLIFFASLLALVLLNRGCASRRGMGVPSGMSGGHGEASSASDSFGIGSTTSASSMIGDGVAADDVADELSLPRATRRLTRPMAALSGEPVEVRAANDTEEDRRELAAVGRAELVEGAASEGSNGDDNRRRARAGEAAPLKPLVPDPSVKKEAVLEPMLPLVSSSLPSLASASASRNRLALPRALAGAESGTAVAGVRSAGLNAGSRSGPVGFQRTVSNPSATALACRACTWLLNFDVVTPP